MSNTILLREILETATLAIERTDEEWDSEEVQNAQNKFTEIVQAIVSEEDYEELENYCIKATGPEIVAANLKLLLEKYWKQIVLSNLPAEALIAKCRHCGAPLKRPEQQKGCCDSCYGSEERE